MAGPGGPGKPSKTHPEKIRPDCVQAPSFLTSFARASLCYALVLPSRKIDPPGQMLARLLLGKNRHGPSGRHSAGLRADFGAFPVAVRPKSGLEVICVMGSPCAWPHIGPVPGTTLGYLWGPGGFPKRVRRFPRDNPQMTQTVSLECLWAAFEGRASRGVPGAARRQPGRPKRGLPLQRNAVF